MENQFTLGDTHSRPVTALGYHPLRRDIFVGYEGKILKSPPTSPSATVVAYPSMKSHLIHQLIILTGPFHLPVGPSWWEFSFGLSM